MADTVEKDPGLNSISRDSRSPESIEAARIARIAKLESVVRGELVLDLWGYKETKHVRGEGIDISQVPLYEVFREPNSDYAVEGEAAKQLYLEGKPNFDHSIVHLYQVSKETAEILLRAATWRE